MAVLNDYHFPSNVRELKNIIERAADRDTTMEITPEDIGMLDGPVVSKDGKFHSQVNEFSRQLIAAALQEANGNQAAAARQVGLPYHRFRYYHKKWSR